MDKKPNIVFILSDDQGPFSLGCLHNSELQTPALDNLAEEGVRFDNCFCGSPVCSPARATILTGTIPSRHGVHDWIRSGNIDPTQYDLTQMEKAHYDYLVEDKTIDYLEGLPTYTEILSENGYNCALSGKWHLGNSAKPQCGFTKWYTIGKGGCNNYMDPDIIEDGKITFPKQYITDLITDKAIEFIDDLAQDEKPFYLNVNYIAPHAPWQAKCHKKEHLDLYKNCDFDKYYPLLPDHPWATAGSKNYNKPENRSWVFRGYEAAITAMDEGIGKIVAELKRLGIYENTILVFTADNGFNMGHHGLIGKGNASYPLNVYEEAIKVPFIASWKGHFAKGAVAENCISHYDLFPTLLELAGITHELDAKQPGKSFVPLLKGEKTEEESVFIYDEYGATRMVRTKQYKYVHRFPDGPYELYDLIADPKESENLYGKKGYEDITLELKNQLFAWFNHYMDPNRDGSLTPATGLGQLLSYESKKGDIFYPHGNNTFREMKYYMRTLLKRVFKQK